MEEAIQIGARSSELTVDDIRAIHRSLAIVPPLNRIAGELREEQGWIGGHSPPVASYVPPPPDYVPSLTSDLCEFMNRDDLSPVAQAAIAHAQFETIHPFGDGNGRVGRCLIHVIFRRRGLTPSYVPPVSLVLGARKDCLHSRVGTLAALAGWTSGSSQFAIAVGAPPSSTRGISQPPWRSSKRSGATGWDRCVRMPPPERSSSACRLIRSSTAAIVERHHRPLSGRCYQRPRATCRCGHAHRAATRNGEVDRMPFFSARLPRLRWPSLRSLLPGRIDLRFCPRSPISGIKWRVEADEDCERTPVPRCKRQSPVSGGAKLTGRRPRSWPGYHRGRQTPRGCKRRGSGANDRTTRRYLCCSRTSGPKLEPGSTATRRPASP